MIFQLSSLFKTVILIPSDFSFACLLLSYSPHIFAGFLLSITLYPPPLLRGLIHPYPTLPSSIFFLILSLSSV